MRLVRDVMREHEQDLDDLIAADRRMAWAVRAVALVAFALAMWVFV